MGFSLFTTLLALTNCLLFMTASGSILQERATATASPTPIAVAPAQNWDGDDGPWSSFTLRIGTPAQNVRVFVSTSSPDTWVVLPAGCAASDSNCLYNRGDTFNYNSSSTWSQHGFYQLGTEQNLNVSVQAVFGNDTLGLGIQGSGGPTLSDQIIGAYTSQELYLGMFGVNPASTNFTPQDEGRPSYLSTLKTQGLIPSLSFGYTAGAQYRLKQVLGSLTLGGVDSSRFTPSNVSIPFAPSPSRELMVGIQAIKSVDQSGKSTNLLPTGIMSLVDSTVPQIWLPVEACQAFEKAFGLTFDETSQLYLVNSSLHDQLRSQNASFVFTLGAAATGGQTADITLPYNSFDLLATPPTAGVANSSRYFPLRQAANDSQYTLGRTFLQEAYLTVDWERNNFSLSQCIFEDNMSQKLVPITSIDAKPTNSSSGGSSTGRTAGIAVGVVVGVLLVVGVLAAYFFFKFKGNKKKAEIKAGAGKDARENLIDGDGFDDKGELGTDVENQRFEMQGSDLNQRKHDEPSTSAWVDEKAAFPPGDRPDLPEVPSGDIPLRAELGSHRGMPARPLHEMPDPSTPPVELQGDTPAHGELQGSKPASATSSPGLFGRRSRGSHAAAASPASPASSRRRRSFRNRFSSRPAASRSSTVDSVPSLTSSTGAAGPSVTIPPKEEVPVGSGHSGEPFSPVSRQGTFSPDPISRQGTFTPTTENAARPQQQQQLFSPVSPSSPEASRGTMFERLRGSSRQGR